MLSSFIWGSREIIFLKLTRKLNIQDTNFWLWGELQLLTLHRRSCLNSSSNWSALRGFYVQKGIVCIFYFHIISLISTVFKLCCPAHLFPNTPRTYGISVEKLRTVCSLVAPLCTVLFKFIIYQLSHVLEKDPDPDPTSK